MCIYGWKESGSAYIYVLVSNDAVGSTSICMMSDGGKSVDGKYFSMVILLCTIH